MINRFIRNFLNGQHIICKVQHVQAVHVACLHQHSKNVCPAAVLSCGARMASTSSNRPSNRSKLPDEYSNNSGSKLLDAYHNNRADNLQLADLGKDAVAFALDPQGSRFIERKLGRANPTVKAQFVDALRGHVVTLALQIYGSHVIEMALKSVDKASQMEIIEELTPRACVIRCIKDHYGSHVMNLIIELIEPQRLQFVVDAILSSPSDSVTSLSLHEYGSLVIQRVHKHCTTQQKRPVLEQILDNVLSLVTDKYGSLVIRHVIEHGLPEDRERIVRSLQENVTSMSLHEYGNLVIQRVLEHCTEQQKRPMLEQILDNLLSLVTDPYGSFVIQHAIEHGLPDDRERIVRSLQEDILKYAQHKFGSLVIRKCLICGTADQKKALLDTVCGGGTETLQNARQLMADEFGHYVIQKFFEYGTEDRKAQLMDALRGHVLTLALQMHGGPMIETALKSVDKASQMEIIEELTPRSCVIRCIKDRYGSHVMGTIFELIEPQRLQFVVDAILSSPSDSVTSLSLHEYGNWVIRSLLERCTEPQKRPLLERLLDNVLSLVTDQYGNFVIRRVIEHGRAEDRERIVRSLHKNLFTLVTDPYGNYVIQYVIEHGLPEDRERIVRSLKGDILKNAHHKGICSVIEKCFVFGTTDQRNALIDQVCADNGSGNPPLLQMMKHSFANDVVLKMHDFADSAHRDKMMFAIEEHIPALLRLQTRRLEQQSLTKRGALVDKRKKSNNNGLLDDLN